MQQALPESSEGVRYLHLGDDPWHLDYRVSAVRAANRGSQHAATKTN